MPETSGPDCHPTDQPPTESSALEDTLRRAHLDGRKMLYAAVGLSIAIVLIITLGPPWMSGVGTVFIIGWGGRQVWRARPGRCDKCGTKTVGGFYEPGRKVNEEWWRLFLFGRPRYDRWSCIEHLPIMVHEMVHDLSTGPCSPWFPYPHGIPRDHPREETRTETD